jgi:hypothetical protein
MDSEPYRGWIISGVRWSELLKLRLWDHTYQSEDGASCSRHQKDRDEDNLSEKR